MIKLDYRSNNRSSQNSLKKHDSMSRSKFKTEKSINQINKTSAQDFQKLLKIQMKNANDLIAKVKSDVSSMPRKQQQRLIYQLRQIEQSIRRTNFTVKQIQAEIYYLKNKKQKTNINIDEIQINLTEEIRGSQNQIIKLRRKIHDKNNLLAHKWQQVRVAQQQYAIKSKNDKKQLIDFAIFKQIQQKRKRQLNKNEKMVENSKKKLISTIWQSGRDKTIINSNNLKINPENKTIKDYMIRKNVAENALKNQRKKHKQELANLMSKLQFLKDEESQIEMKMKAKSKQLHNAEKKFSQSRNIIQNELLPKKYKTQKLKTVD